MSKIILLSWLTMALFLWSCSSRNTAESSPQENSEMSLQEGTADEPESTQMEDGEEVSPFPLRAISLTSCGIKEISTGEYKHLWHSTPMTILNEMEGFYEVRLDDLEGTWKIETDLVVIGEEAIAEHKANRLLSTFQENPSDGYSWNQRAQTFIHNDPLTKETLLSTIWKQDRHSWSLLVFYSDDIYKYGSYQSGVWFQGNYEIRGNRVILHNFLLERATTTSENREEEGISLEMEYSNINNFDATHGLVNHDLDLVLKAMGTLPEAGAEVFIQEVQAQYLDRPGSITDNCSGIREFKAGNDVELEAGKGVQVLGQYNSQDEEFFYVFFEEDNSEFVNPVYLWVSSEYVELAD